VVKLFGTGKRKDVWLPVLTCDCRQKPKKRRKDKDSTLVGQTVQSGSEGLKKTQKMSAVEPKP